MQQTASKPIWKQEFTLEGLQMISQNTLVDHLGIQFTGYGPDYLEASMPVDRRTIQPMGLLHGGASAALAETLGSVASVLCLPDPLKEQVVGVELNANHLLPATKGAVVGRVSPLRVGRRIHVWNIEIRDEEGEKICVSRLTIAVISR
jgi:1,4-dihydroxy-2-naphthoyl-CoA hydrolase